MDIKDSKIEIFDLILERDKLQKEINSLIEQKLKELDELQVKENNDRKIG